MSVFIVATVLVIFTSLWLLYRKVFYYWKDLGVPQFPITLPEGNAKGIGKKFHLSRFLVDYYNKTKDIGASFSGIYLFTRPILFVTDLELVKTILVKDFNVFPNRGQYHNERDDPVSAHLFNIENDKWRNLRQKLSPTFTSGKIKMMFGTICEVADKLLGAIDKQIEATGQLVVKDTLARFTTDVIGSAAFGIDCNSLEEKDSKFFEMGTKINKQPSNFLKRTLRTTFKGLALKLHIKVLSESVSSFYMGITKEIVEYREKNPQVNRQDFMSLLVQMKKSNEITVEQIAAQSYIFFLAGHESSSSTMTFCMYEFSINEELQKKARQSVEDAIAKHGGLTYEAVVDMDYLEQCVNEAIRKYPFTPNLLRCSIKNYKIPNSDVTIPKDQIVWIPVHAIHHDASIYPEPEKFDPDRFTPEEAAKRHPFAFLPFGEGPRVCIAMRFGLVQIKLGLAKLLSNYKFTLDRTKTTSPLKMSLLPIVLSPEERIYLNIEKIRN